MQALFFLHDLWYIDRNRERERNMIDIEVQDLSKEFIKGKKILNGLSFRVDSGERVGLLGQNGTGKTTVLRILMGEVRPDSGTVRLPPNKKIGLISQIPRFPAGFTVEDVLRTAFEPLKAMEREMEELSSRLDDVSAMRRYGELSHRFEAMGGYETDTKLNRIAQGLSLTADFLRQPYDTLSGGEQTRINLARLLLEDTDILLLDEPTNHLDMRAVQWLEDYLEGYAGTVLAVSHDRYFLDRVVKRIIEIRDGKAVFFSGNYSFYAEERRRRLDEQARQYEKEQKKVAQLEAAADRIHLWAFLGADKLHRTAFSIEKRIERIQTVDKPKTERMLHQHFESRDFHGDTVLAAENLSKRYDTKTLFSGLDLTIRGGGERIALIGENGTGKSTLVRILLGLEKPDTGRVVLGPSVRTGYLKQDVSFPDPWKTLTDTLVYSEQGFTVSEARNRLAAFGFRGEDSQKYVGELSGGELRRLALCLVMKGETNFLILDEPTNHLDIASCEWIEEAVEAYPSTLLLVSHDRYFIRKFAERIWELRNGRIIDWPCGYDEYLRLSEAQPRTETSKAPPRDKKQRQKREDPQTLRRRLTVAEQDLAHTEAAMDKLKAEMENCGSDYNLWIEKDGQLKELQAVWEQQYSRWEELSEQLEKKENS